MEGRSETISGREGSGRERSWWQRLRVVMEAAISIPVVVAVVVVVVTAHARRP
jgi:hypothetical protein